MSGAFALLFALLLAVSFSAVAGSASWAADADQQQELNERMQHNGGHGSEDLGEAIPPVLVDGTQKLNPYQLEPIDPTAIEITTITPADRFIRATTPLLAALTLGAIGMLGLAISQAVRKRSVGEIRLGE